MSNTETPHDHFDVAVVGGGSAGMMAAGRVAELGKKVVLIEKNKVLGKKLLITGKGRCNLTNATFDVKEFINKLGKNGKFIFSSLLEFGPNEIIDFFEKRGVKTKIERGKRVFPVSDRSKDILDTLVEYLKKNNASIILGEKIVDFKVKNKKIEYLELPNRKIYADSFVLSTGGKSYPTTGSTGDGYNFAQKLGHKLINPSPALVPLKTQESWTKGLQGLSLKNARATVFAGGKKQDSRFGEMLFTHFGVSGPIILDLSKKVVELLQKGVVTLQIDLKPALDYPTLDKRLQKDFEANVNKDFINYLPDLLPRKMINLAIQMSRIDPHAKLGTISREERKKLLHFLKELTVTISEPMGYEIAVITSGGIDLKEIDPRTMRSKIISNLFFAGEILDLDGPTGGFNLQICWSTGYVAGEVAGCK